MNAFQMSLKKGGTFLYEKKGCPLNYSVYTVRNIHADEYLGRFSSMEEYVNNPKYDKSHDIYIGIKEENGACLIEHVKEFKLKNNQHGVSNI